MMDDRTRFAAYPSAVVYSKPRTSAIKNARQHLLWGDWLQLLGPRDGTWCKVKARGVKGWMHESQIQEDRLLEVNFVDIGQGDGCLIVTPDDEFIVVDAGEQDNMYRFLRWRFGRFREDIHFESFVITHPDKDHYYGFRKLLAHEKVHVGTLYHNGIVERKGAKNLGPEKQVRGIAYLDNIIVDRRRLESLLDEERRNNSRKRYPRILRAAVEGGRVDDVRMLSSRDGHMPGYGPDATVTIEVLAPVPEQGSDRKWRLRRFGDDGKTKNGHSIVLKLRYGAVSVLLGGDLNSFSERYVLKHYTKIDPDKASASQRRTLISRARKVFKVDVAKACHHGSADFTETFLKTVNPIATIVSSGDEESHAHPRPDALGAFGRYGRGVRPLIFSTELARSSRETVKHPYQLRREIADLRAEAREGSTEAVRTNAQRKLDALLSTTIERSVAVYGMITVRTDGERVVIAQKLERPRNKKSKWDLHRLEPGRGGRLRYVSKHLVG